MKTIKKLLNTILFQFPTPLPKGMTEFHAWADSIINHYDMPNNDSTKWPLAIAIMHLPPTASRIAKSHFGRTLLKGAANQVADSYMRDAKEKQKIMMEQYIAEQKAAQSAEVTATTAVENTSDNGTQGI